MTFTKEIELSCDGPPGSTTFSCELTRPIFASSVARAWREAREEGWVKAIRGRKTVHLCPGHRGAKSEGACSSCGLTMAVGVTGLVHSHKIRNDDGSYRKWALRCPGSGRPPRAVTEDATNPRAETRTGQ